MTIKITDQDFPPLQEYIQQQCGIVLRDTQQYLLESRLQHLLSMHQCGTFGEFLRLVKEKNSPVLREKIVNAMTTNETFWFRDSHPWQNFAAHLLPQWEKELQNSLHKKRIWSAAASMGHEAYSMAMLIDDFCGSRHKCAMKNSVEILGTDISTSALYVAISGNYDEMAMSRGFTPPFDGYRRTCFKQTGKVWEISSHIKKMVVFKQFNLQNSFITLDKFDLICLRNVIIYFSDEFKRALFKKIAQTLNPGGYLLLGASETPIRYTRRFRSVKLGDSVYYQLKE
ncbi:MAG: protein-glutamate O-methyltransferase CheR [Deltaproteobacteria bacterium]|nr:protein-glutamate O-methyltransferase CheR [Deltaproteobacteria bacterium]